MPKLALPLRSLLAWALLLVPTPAVAQDRDPAALIRSLPLDTLPGAVKVYYSPGYSARAAAIQPWYLGAVLRYQRMFPGDAARGLKTSVAVLNPSHWAAFTAMPYGLPHIQNADRAEAIAVLPAAGDQGVMADAFRKLQLPVGQSVDRLVDVIGLHELGHALVSRHLYALVPHFERGSLRWFDEFMATYMGQGFLWELEGPESDPITRLSWGLEPRYTSLDDFDAHYGEFSTPEGFATLGWYQTRFAERGRAVFARQGLEFVRRVRDELPWASYQEWRTDELLGWLESIEPGFVAWARSFGQTAMAATPRQTGPLAPGEHTVTLRGVRLWYLVRGTGPVLIVQPGGAGWGGDATIYIGTLEPLERTNTVVYLEPRGIGRSGRLQDPSLYSMQNYVEDLEALRRHLGLERFALLGHSHGGFVALSYALAHGDRLDHLLLLDTGPSFERGSWEDEWLPARPGYAEAEARWAAIDTAGRSPADLHREQVRIFLPVWHFHDYSKHAARVDSLLQRSTFSPEPFRYWSANERDRYDLRSRLAEIRVPTLLVLGDEDYPPLLDGSRLAQERIPGARLQVVPQSGHWPMIERPDVFFPVVLRFLGESRGAGPEHR